MPGDHGAVVTRRHGGVAGGRAVDGDGGSRAVGDRLSVRVSISVSLGMAAAASQAPPLVVVRRVTGLLRQPRSPVAVRAVAVHRRRRVRFPQT